MFLAGTSSGSSQSAWLSHFRLRRRRRLLPWSVVLGLLGRGLTTSPPSLLMVRMVMRMVVMVVVGVRVVVVRVVVQRFLLAVYTAHVVMMTECKLSAVPPHTCTSLLSPLQLLHRASDNKYPNISSNISYFSVLSLPSHL